MTSYRMENYTNGCYVHSCTHVPTHALTEENLILTCKHNVMHLFCKKKRIKLGPEQLKNILSQLFAMNYMATLDFMMQIYASTRFF